MGGRAKDRKVDGEGGVMVRVLPANGPDVLTPPIQRALPLRVLGENRVLARRGWEGEKVARSPAPAVDGGV